MNLAIRYWDTLTNWLEPKPQLLRYESYAEVQQKISNGIYTPDSIKNISYPMPEDTTCQGCKKVLNIGNIFIYSPPPNKSDLNIQFFHSTPACFTYFKSSTSTLLQDSARPLTNIILNFPLFSALTAAVFYLKTDPRIIKTATSILWARYTYLLYTNLKELAYQKNCVFRFESSQKTELSQETIQARILLVAASIVNLGVCIYLAKFSIYNFNQFEHISPLRKWSIPFCVTLSGHIYRSTQKLLYYEFLEDPASKSSKSS